ncbi:hypothetical protein QR680_005779 [Steinernema hermaphroditum]|uniref:Globin domain-containing protein n=1 Tax=Steinernema hermaphroditum TaxID=289476 RepID=A0AA39HTC6_9BILA|nr:hypothetical protein QR680_005779 [Steinernema hermaphroditum]
MYSDYQVNEVVVEALENVMNGAARVDEVNERIKILSDLSEKLGVDDDGEILDSDDDEVGELEEIQLARAHWIQLYKTNMQSTVIYNVFQNILKEHPHVRPIWKFGRSFDADNPEWRSALENNIHFRHHCASLQAAITMIMENLDDVGGMSRLLQEIGTHHFFYDAFEPHLELLQDVFLTTIKELLEGSTEAVDDRLERAWLQLFTQIRAHIGHGIAMQRLTYLAQCATTKEIESVKEMWEKVKDYGTQEAGVLLCQTALQAYGKMVKKQKICLPISMDRHSEMFEKFSMQMVRAIDVTIQAYDPTHGFASLPDNIGPLVTNCMVLEVCPSLVRKAVMEGLVAVLQTVLEHLSEQRHGQVAALSRP